MPLDNRGAEPVAYRDAVVQDAPALAAFAARTFTETFGHLYPPEDLAAFLAAKYGAEIQAREIATPGMRYELALRGEEIVGYCQLGPYELPIAAAGTPFEIHRLYVDASVKGAGVAQTLMQHALAWAREQGADSLWLSVWENNARAQAFYKRYGFTHMGEHKFMVGRVADRDFVWRLGL
ncbi:MAG: GNAT family N-acetyltransferase [Hyphomonadaceae bacterium]|nr:GNAT family N-acetyltransferase [Hyphomonadaceae bacterium]